MPSKAPRTLVVLLGIILAGSLGLVLLQGRLLIFPLLQLGFFAFFAWRAIRGQESAAKVLAVLLLLGAALNVYDIVRIAASDPIALVFVPWVALLAGTAVYIFRSKDLEAYYAARAYAD